MRIEDLAELCNEQCPIFDVLDACGVNRQKSGQQGQVRCPFHKEGQENKWSARAYEKSNRLWCYTENHMYTVIDIVMHSKELDLRGAVAWCRAKYPIDQTKLPQKATVERNPVLDQFEERMRKFRGKADLKRYRQIAYAITMTRDNPPDPDDRATRYGKIKQAIDALGVP